jgi:acetyl-CoA carboxylase carboxyltransferase component
MSGACSRQAQMTEPSSQLQLAPGEVAYEAPMSAVVVDVAAVGSQVSEGGTLALLEAMKMQHVVSAREGVVVGRTLVAPGDTVLENQPLVIVTPAVGATPGATTVEGDADAVRTDLTDVRERHALGLDHRRTAAIAKRHGLNRRSARENIGDLVDPGSFVEYGALAIAAQRGRRTEPDLIENTPGDGLVAGLATINADLFGRDRAAAVVLSYDYTVLAGTQGMRNHAKTDRLFNLAARRRVPVVLFPEGGGGRPGEVDSPSISGLDVTTFHEFGRLSGAVPLVAVVSGRCFAGNAALLGMCDVVIATPDANIGMGGPAMIEGGGLGSFRPEEIGPIDVQRRNGVVHIVADDEAGAVAIAKQYLSYFQGAIESWEAPDEHLARHAVPEDRLRAYEARGAISAIVDVGSVLELRRDHGIGVVTALVRVEGHPFGLVANNTHHLGGAIDATAADKLAAFLTLCDSFGLPVVSLCDTPGFMVGPQAETEASVTRFSRLFIVGAGLRVPLGTVILRKAYGLGAQAMAAGSFRAPQFVVAWPTGEIGAMGLEGAVRLGFRKELEAAPGLEARDRLFNDYVDLAYQRGRALTAATAFEIDDVIDPADTRRWILTLRRR